VGRVGMTRVGDVVWCDLGASILLCLVDYCFDNEHALGWIQKKTLTIFWFALHFVFGLFFCFLGCLLGVFCLGSFEFRCYPLLESFVCVFFRCASMHKCIEKGNRELWGHMFG
jgi:hypothetical protein